MSLNLAECFFQMAAKQSEQPLILGPGETDVICYGDFSQQVQELAVILRNFGVGPGDNVGLHYPNGSNYVAYTYAIWTCGACVTPIPVELAAQEKQQIFQFIHLDAVISATRLLNEIDTLKSEAAVLTFTESAVLFRVKFLCELPAELSSVNAAFIRFTSGTTGRAKGVVLSHETIFARIHAANEAMQLQPGERVLWLLSMAYHFTVSIVAYLTFGAAIVLPRNSFGVSLLQAATRHKVTLIYGAPNHYNMMVNDNTGLMLPETLRLAVVTTTALRAELGETFHRRFGQVLNETYGIIELGLPAVNLSQSRAKQGSVGIALSGYELKLDEQTSEILVRGEAMLDAYYSPWKSRTSLLQEKAGWFHTGDLGRLDNDGFLYIVGRNKEIISVGGMKFFPQEVERVLEQHPAIKAACVFRHRDRHLGEVPHAQLVMEGEVDEPELQELNAFCRCLLAAYKIPKKYHFVTQLTYTASGKLVRDPLKLIREDRNELVSRIT